jgi:hypothetical protein
MYSFDGEQGMTHMNNLCSDLGYESDGFKWGSSFERFIQDNPGCSEVIIDWIRDQCEGNSPWLEGLKEDKCDEDAND